MTAPTLDFWALVFTLGAQAAGLLIWGASLTQRVKRLEQEIIPLKAMPEKIARIEERMEMILDQFRDLNASIRWMREPASETMINPRK